MQSANYKFTSTTNRLDDEFHDEVITSIDLGTYYPNGFISKYYPISIKVHTKKYGSNHDILTFQKDSLDIENLGRHRGCLFIGNKIDPMQLITKPICKPSWIVTQPPNCIAIRNDGAFKLPKSCSNIASSTLFEERPSSISKNVQFCQIGANKPWLYANKTINKNGEFILNEAAAIIKDDADISMIINMMRISNKIIDMINYLKIDINTPPEKVMEMIITKQIMKWISTFNTLVRRFNLQKSELYETGKFLQKIISQ